MQHNLLNRSAEVGDFYEEYVQHHVPYHRNPRGLKGFILSWLPYWSWREWRFWRKHVPHSGLLLDVGCARGREVFVERAESCIGVDIAQTALRECARHYKLAIRSSLRPLPLADESVDCVVTSHVLGHIPVEEKDGVFSEIVRVLKRGGKTLHLVETDGAGHDLVQYAKQYPELYVRHFIDPDRHVGLEKPSSVLKRFERHGLRLLRCFKMDAGPFHPRVVLKHFDNELSGFSKNVSRRVKVSRWIMNHAAVLAAAEVLLGFHHYTAGQWAYPLDRAQFLAVVLQKQ